METESKRDFWSIYPKEVIEAFMILLIIQGIMDKPINIVYIFKMSCIVGLIIFIGTNIVNEEFNGSVKDGIRNGVGYYIFSSLAS